MYVIPEESLESLKCSTCKNLLSFFPIFLIRDKSMICGRCSVSEEQLLMRNDTYETLASLMHFPCRYRSSNCGAYLLPEDIPEHEKSCPYQPSKCPTALVTQCWWEGPEYQYVRHCHEFHFSNMCTTEEQDEFEIKPSEDKEYKMLTYKSKLYLFMYEFHLSDGCLDISFVAVQNDHSECVLLVNIEGDAGKLSVKCLPVGNMTQPYSHRIITTNYLKTEESAIIRCTIEIVSANNNTVSQKVSPINFDTWSCFQCEECHKYSQNLRESGEKKYCLSCFHIQFSSLEDYDEIIEEAQDVTVSVRSVHLSCSCEFSNNGCTYSHGVLAVASHSKQCQYKKIKCPKSSDCEEILLKDLNLHLASQHRDTICGDEIYLSDDDCTVTNFAEQWFLLTWSRREDTYIWKMKLLTTNIPNPVQMFSFYIDIVSQYKNQRMILSGLLEEGESEIEINLKHRIFNEFDYKDIKFKYYIIETNKRDS